MFCPGFLKTWEYDGDIDIQGFVDLSRSLLPGQKQKRVYVALRVWARRYGLIHETAGELLDMIYVRLWLTFINIQQFLQSLYELHLLPLGIRLGDTV